MTGGWPFHRRSPLISLSVERMREGTQWLETMQQPLAYSLRGRATMFPGVNDLLLSHG